MEIPSLQFVEELYSQDELNSMMKQFRDKGYVVLPDVLKRETVDSFNKQLESIMFHDGLSWRIPDDSPHYIHLANTPRGYQVLAPALSRSATKPMPCLHTTMVVIQKGADGSNIPEWHKDREPDGMPANEYHWPLDVFLGFYMEDMTEDHGPTLVIPGSHKDPAITPWNGMVEPEAIYCRKQDALLLDQRTWHRGTARKVTGNRFLIIYGYYALPHFYGTTFRMPRAQRNAWINSDSRQDRVLFGGPFAPPVREDLEHISEAIEEREKSGKPKLSTSVAY